MRFLRHLLALSLTLTLVGTVTSVILGQTLFHADFLQREAEKAHTYTALQAAVPTELTKKATDSLSADEIAAISRAIPADFLQTKVSDALIQFENYYLHDGPAPAIALGDVTARLRAAGVDVDPATIPATITVPTEKLPLQPVFHTYRQSVWIGPLSVLLLALALGALCWREGNFRPLARSVATAGAALAALAIVFALTPGLIERFIKVQGQAAVFASIARDYVSQLARDLTLWFAVPGLLLLALGIGAWVFLHYEEDRPKLKSLRHKAPATT